MSTPDHPARWQQPTLPAVEPYQIEPFDDDDPDSGLVWVLDGEGEYLAEIVPDLSTSDDDGLTP